MKLKIMYQKLSRRGRTISSARLLLALTLTSSLRNSKRSLQPMIMVSMALNTVITALNMVKKATDRRPQLRRALKNQLRIRRNLHGMLLLMKIRWRILCRTRSRPLTWMIFRQSQSKEGFLNLLKMKLYRSKTNITVMLTNKRKPRKSSQQRKLANQKTK